jgi:hypothetical protein
MHPDHRRHLILLFVMALMALPAAAQSEVSPDHFEDQPSTKSSNAAPQTGHKTLQQRMAAEQAQLESYLRQIKEKAAQVEKARQLQIASAGSTNELGNSMTLAEEEKGLKRLKQSLAGPIHETEARIARLQNKLRGTPTTTVARQR